MILLMYIFVLWFDNKIQWTMTHNNIDTKHDNNQHYDIQHNYIQHNKS